MSYFPFYIDITNKTFLIIGGGPVALEKVNRLRRFTNSIIVIAPQTEITGVEVSAPRGNSDEVQILRREYREEDLNFADYVVAATGIREVDRGVAADCRLRKIPVNVVDDREFCDFIFPGIVKRDALTVAISTDGTSPAYAMQLRGEIEKILPAEIGAILERMGRVRSIAAQRIPDQKKRAACYRELLAALIESGNRTTEEEIRTMIEKAAR